MGETVIPGFLFLACMLLGVCVMTTMEKLMQHRVPKDIFISYLVLGMLQTCEKQVLALSWHV
jgi:uncharacterized membrane protein